jgi:hypothetical protein
LFNIKGSLDDPVHPNHHCLGCLFAARECGAGGPDNRAGGLWPATAYYSVVESCTHYFISYSFFHPRDWSDTIFDQEHENDLEGALLAVRKDGSTFGRLEGMITVFHTNFFFCSRRRAAR